MKPQACIPCAKRKVRCDREEPCSNCKRRKQDDCTYIESTPQDRIAQLEAHVRQLGGDPEKPNTTSESEQVSPTHRKRGPAEDTLPSRVPKSTRTAHVTGSQQVGDPVLIKHNGASIYLESPIWYCEQGKLASPKHLEGELRIPVPTRNAHPLVNVLKDDPSVDLIAGHPTARVAAKFWQVFYRSVHPLHNLSFERELGRIRNQPIKDLSTAEHAFLFSLYCLTVTSLSRNECLAEFDTPLANLFEKFQMYSEHALARCDILETSDLVVMQALVMYTSAGFERMNTKSLWAFLGLVVRIAERIGLHRDGAILKLTPYETERRRRIWWQLQQLDIGLGVFSGSLSLSSMSDWDTKLPLNIEDDDISPTATEFPKEREGITSKTYSIWMYWLFQTQRSFYRADGSRLGFGWIADPTLSMSEKVVFVNRLEAGLNERLRFCDPIKADDMLIQTTGRAMMCGFRRLILHIPVVNGQEDSRRELLDISVRCLEYHVLLHSTRILGPFRWRMTNFFPWSSLIHVLSEASQDDERQVTRIWELILEVYTTNEDLWRLLDDQRKFHAAELIVAAWKRREKKLQLEKASRPAIIVALENHILESKKGDAASEASNAPRDSDPADTDQLSTPAYLDPGSFDPASIAELNFDDIDWSYWDGLDFTSTM